MSFNVVSSLEIGLVYAIVSIAVWLSFKVTNFADLSVDSSFVTGAAVSAVAVLAGLSPIIAVFLSMLTGFAVGFITGILHTRFNISDLLSGILVMTALYSINLRIMDRPNMVVDVFILPSIDVFYTSIIVVSFIFILLSWFMLTELGLAVRAVGSNRGLSGAFSMNDNFYIVLSIAISNSLAALAGSVFANSQGFVDISMGIGTIIVGLASVIIGESIMRSRNILISILSCIVGSILYRIFIALALNIDFLNLRPSDLNMVTAGIILLVLVFSKGKVKY